MSFGVKTCLVNIALCVNMRCTYGSTHIHTPHPTHTPTSESNTCACP